MNDRDSQCAGSCRVQVEVNERIQRAYIKDRSADFIDWCFADPDIIRRYLDETGGALHTWIKEVLSA